MTGTARAADAVAAESVAGPPDPAARRRMTTRRWTEAGVVLVAVMLIAGVTFGAVLGGGTGAGTSHAVDGLTWLRDSRRGEAVQVDPANGRTEQRLAVAGPGQEWALAQRDGLLIITLADGTVTVIDVATLATVGRYHGGAGTLVLLDEDRLFVVQSRAGIIRQLDPADASVIGGTWSAGAALADAVLDGAGTIWVLRIDGRLSHLRWTPSGLVDATAPVTVPGAGPEARLVAHPTGVTVLAPAAGTATRVGTAADLTIAVPGLTGGMRPARQAPVDLVPIGGPVVLIINGTAVTTVDARPYGCADPGVPAVHIGLIYLPCAGDSRVLVLDAVGVRAAPDVIVGPGTDPEITISGGRLYITAPGATGTIVGTDGTRVPLSLGDGGLPTAPAAVGDPDPVAVPPADIHDTYTAPGPECPWPDSCQHDLWIYLVDVVPPPSWDGYGGVCTLHPAGTTNPTPYEIPCTGGTWELGQGDGGLWSVTVEACAGSDCVRSAVASLRTKVSEG